MANRYTFSWSLEDAKTKLPRGGTSQGPAVKLSSTAQAGWLKLQEEGLSKFERDRMAILAMQGPYRVSFDFLETIPLNQAYQLADPYQSWATEYVYLLEDSRDFISLQHIMVMFYKTKTGEIHGPVVMKHWRQDWKYQDQDLHTYRGKQKWERIRYKKHEVKGKWSQAVFQVDDSPRYEALGTWMHEGNLSSWRSERTARPLPRREFSVRDDYTLLLGYNTHTITPTGWIHEQENYKVKLDSDRSLVSQNPFLVKEIGLNRYEQIVGHDFTAADNYWKRTAPYWLEVRKAWKQIFKAYGSFRIKKSVKQEKLYQKHFAFAESLQGNRSINQLRLKEHAERSIGDFVIPTP